MFRSIRINLVALFLFAGAIPAARAADDLELQFLAKAPEIIDTLRDAGCKNVGVLKFHIKKGANPSSDRVGALNRRLSDKLELALTLKNPNEPKPGEPDLQVKVLRDPNRIAASIAGAAHTSAEGRKRLFTKTYPTAWGKDPENPKEFLQVVPDAFIIGEAVIAADLKTMDVFLRVFSRNNPETLVNLCKVDKVKLDLEDLLEAGESFSVRGVFDQGKVLLTADARKDQATQTAVQTALVVKPESTVEPVSPTKPAAKSKGHPLSPDSDAPVALEIYYDNQLQPIQFQGGVAFVAEPKQGQKVVYVARRKGASAARLGVVLKVNGENTLFKQRMSDDLCTPWVFESETPAFSVAGFRINDQKEELFAVLSQAESKAKEVDYGEHVGLISISVFPEKPAELVKLEKKQADEKEAKRLEAEISKKPLNEPIAEGDDFAILNRAEFPTNPGDSLKDLKNSLGMLNRPEKKRGIVTGGQENESKLKRTPFQADNLPLMSATVRYYNPSDLPK